MKAFSDKKILSTIIKANIFILLSCLGVGITEFFYCIPVYMNYNSSFMDYLSLFIYTICFYSILHFFISFIVAIIIMVSSYINNKKRYYFIILSFIFTLLNIIPFYIVASYFLKAFSGNNFYHIILTFGLSVCVSTIIAMLIVNSYNDFINTAKKYTLFVFIFFLILVGGVFSISDKILDSNQYLLSYYLLLALIFYFLIFYNYYIAFQDKPLFIIKYKYLLIPSLIAIILTIILFPTNLKLETMVKKFIPFEKNIISYISQILDFDRDGFGPEFFISEGDIDNFNPKRNPYMKDKPENSIDENGINGDLNKFYLNRSNKAQTSTQKFTDQNIILITIDNINILKELDNKDGFFTELINKGVYFPQALSVSKNKVVALNGLFNSNLRNIKNLDRKKQILPTSGSIFSLYDSKDYTTHVFLDIPYSAINDIFFLNNDTNTLFANNNKLEYPVSTQNISSILKLYEKKNLLSWIYFDNKIPVPASKRVKSIFETLQTNKTLDNTLFVFVFLPENFIYDNDNYYTSPILFYNKNLEPKIINEHVSHFDILPTLNSFSDISNKDKGYLGTDLSKLITSNDDLQKRALVSINSDGSVISIIYENNKLIYSVSKGFYEIYDLEKDPNQKNNLINKDKSKFKPLFYWLDFYLANGSKK